MSLDRDGVPENGDMYITNGAAFWYALMVGLAESFMSG